MLNHRSLVGVVAAVAMLATALPVQGHVTPIDTSTSCPSTIPAVGFTDVSAFPSDTRSAIDCIAFYGITIGTSPTTYSPTQATLRRQMALFLIRQARIHGVAIPAPVDQGFTDLVGLPQADRDAINQLAQLGITRGTSATTFDPDGHVERWQMALFLRRLAMKAGVSFTSDATHNEFTDLGELSAEARSAINDLADAHIALGVGGSLFDPFSPVSRWQMALFLTRVLAADGVTPTAPTAPTGLAGDFTVVSVGTDGFVGHSGSSTFTFAFGDGDTYRYNSALTVTKSQFLSWLSAGDVVEVTGYGLAGSTIFDMTTDVPNAPGSVSGSVGGADVTISWAAATGGNIASYAVTLYDDDGNVGTSCSSGTVESGPASVGSSTTSHVFAGVADGSYCGVVVATTGTGHTSSGASSAVTVASGGGGGTPTGPTIVSLALTRDESVVGLWDSGDELTFDFSASMSSSLGSGATTWLQITDSDSTYQYNCLLHLTVCTLSDGPSTGGGTDRFTTRMSAAAGQLVAGADNGISLTASPTVTAVSSDWTDLSSNLLDLVNSADVTID